MTKAELYAQYLESDHWKTLRAEAKKVHGHTCAVCSRKPVQMHHLRYGDWYDVTPEDLIPLCGKHHKQAHTNQEALALIYCDATSEQKRRRLLEVFDRNAPKLKKRRHKPQPASNRAARQRMSTDMLRHLKILKRIEKHTRWLSTGTLKPRLIRHHEMMLAHWKKQLRNFTNGPQTR